MNWPHAPLHKLDEAGTYIVTASTYQKEHHFRSRERLSLLQQSLIEIAQVHGWDLQAWAVFSNHYHFVGVTETPSSLVAFLKELHSRTAREINQIDDARGRQVWFQFWDTRITFEKSYLARLNYVIMNPVKHGLVNDPLNYEWCSAAWFERTATQSFAKTVATFDYRRVSIRDDYAPILEVS